MKKICTIAILLLSTNILKIQAQFVCPNDVCSGDLPMTISNSSQLQIPFTWMTNLLTLPYQPSPIAMAAPIK